MVALVAVAIVALIAVIVWSIVRTILRSPDLIAMFMSHRRGVRGYLAISRGLIAVGAGDASAAKRASNEVERIAPGEPLALLLNAQVAQLSGDRAAAEHAFRAMAERDDTKLLGLRGLYIEAQRRKDMVAARAYAEEAAERLAGARLGRTGGAGIPLRVRRLVRRAFGARSQQPLRPDRQGRLQTPARGAAHRAGAGGRGNRARPRPLARARCSQARADAGAGRRAGRPAARRRRRTAPCQPDHREGVDGQSASRSGGHLRASSPGRFGARAAGARADRWR